MFKEINELPFDLKIGDFDLTPSNAKRLSFLEEEDQDPNYDEPSPPTCPMLI